MNETKHLSDALAILRQRRDAISLGPDWPWQFVNHAMNYLDQQVTDICVTSFRSEAL